MRPFGTWKLVEALEFAASFAPVAAKAGYGIALAGSVLVKGESKKDLDIIVFPHRTDLSEEDDIRESMIAEMGMEQILDEASVKAHWKREYDSNDAKRVEVWTWLGKRIDIFFLR